MAKWLLITALFAFWLSQIGYGVFNNPQLVNDCHEVNSADGDWWQKRWYELFWIILIILLRTNKYADNYWVMMFSGLAVFALVKEFTGSALKFMYNDYILGLAALVSAIVAFVLNQKKCNGKYE